MTEFISIELDEQHQLDEFDCGVPELNRWLAAQAHRARVSGTARTYVWTRVGSDRVVAYFSIAPHLLCRDGISGGMSGGVSSVPSYLLARLAVDQTLQGNGLGGQLLLAALEVIVQAADVASGRLIVVDAIDEQAAAFYRKYDFVPVKGNARRLVLKVATARKALG